MKRIILTADDYGAHPFIDAGIIEAVKNKRINTVSVFVTHPDSQQAVQTLLSLRNEMLQENFPLHIGLHFSITSGVSIARHKTITYSDGYFKEPRQLFRRRKIDEREVGTELRAELMLLDGWLGDVKIDHVSNHHGMTYVDRDFYNQYIATIKQYDFQGKYTHRTIAIRSPASWMKSNLNFLDYDKKLSVPIVRSGIKLGYLRRALQILRSEELNYKLELARQHQIVHADCTADTIYGQPYLHNLEFLLDQYEKHDITAEFMFHLGAGSHNGTGTHGVESSYFANREKELEMLLAWKPENYLGPGKIDLISFSNL